MQVRVLVGSLVSVLIVSGFAFAHTGAKGIVKERMDAMSDIASQMKTIGAMLQGKEPFNGERAAKSAGAIKAHASGMLKLFPKGSNKHPSEALPAIWADWATFETMNSDLANKASAFAEMASSVKAASELRNAFQGLAATCKSCHQKFRQPK